MTAIPQHMQALANANEIRLGTAAFKRSVRILRPKDAAELVADTIENDHEDMVLGTLRIQALLCSVPRLGTTKSSKCLTVAGVANYDKRLRDLTPRQRKAVAAQLRMWAFGYGSHRP